MAKKITQFRYFGDNNYDAELIAAKTKLEELEAIGWDTPEEELEIKNQIAELEIEIANYQDLLNKQHNNPSTLTKAKLVSGTAFESCTPIIKLGIQTIPGVKFRVNANIDYIIVGATGIYELDLSDSSATIQTLNFYEGSIQTINQNEDAYLIIDILYNGED